eukprot:Nk52_evm26s288 gene=Nk52_evmTU26s288
MIELSEPRFFGQALQRLALNAAKIAPSTQTSNAVQRLRNYSFAMSSSAGRGGGKDKSQKKVTLELCSSPLSDSIVRRNSEALMAICLFLNNLGESKVDGGMQEELFNYLIDFINCLPYYDWPVLGVFSLENPKPWLQAFTLNLLKCVSNMREAFPDKSGDLQKAILELAESSPSLLTSGSPGYVAHVGLPIVFGILEGLVGFCCEGENIQESLYSTVQKLLGVEVCSSVVKSLEAYPQVFSTVFDRFSLSCELVEDVFSVYCSNMLCQVISCSTEQNLIEKHSKELATFFGFAVESHRSPNKRLYGSSLTKIEYGHCVRRICATLRLMTVSCRLEESTVVLRTLKEYMKVEESSESVYQELIVTCLEGHLCLGKEFPSLLNLVIDSVFHFLINSSGVLVFNPEFVNLRNGTLSTVSSIMKLGLVHDRNNVDAFISRLANKLYIIDADDEASAKANDPIRENVVISLGYVCREISDLNISETCCKIFQRRLAEPTSSLDASIVEQLSHIAIVGDEKAHNLIVDQFLVISKDLGSDKYKFCRDEVTAALFRIGVKLENPILLNELLLKLLKLFVFVGNEIQMKCRSRECNASSMAGNLGVLLPVLSIVIEKISTMTEPKSSMITLFRHTWFYCVIFGFVNPTMWIDDWYAAVRKIASNAPALIVTKAHSHLDQELELNSVLEIGKKDQTSAEELSSFRKQLDKLLNNSSLSRVIQSSSMTQCSYLLALYHLESMRAEFGDFIVSFGYLKDKGVRSTDIAPVVACVVDKAFVAFLDKQVDTTGSFEKDENLARHVKYLLVNFNHQDKVVKRAADQYLSQIISKFPHILWSGDVSKCALDFLDSLGKSVGDEGHIKTTKVCIGKFTVTLPEDNAIRCELLKDFSNLCQRLIGHSLGVSEERMRDCLQNYILGFESEDCSRDTHTGLSLALEYASTGTSRQAEHFPKTLRDELSSCCKSKGGDFVSHMALKSRSLNIYLGMLNMFDGSEAMGMFDGSEFKSKPPSETKLCDVIKSKLEGLLKLGSMWCPEDTISSRYSNASSRRSTSVKFKESKKIDNFDIPTFKKFMYLATACIISENSVNSDLITLVVNASCRIFSKSVLEVCVFCWRWIATARPEFELELFCKMSAAWSQTIEREFGMFSRFHPSVNPLFSAMSTSGASADNSKSQKDSICSFEPHVIWIDFLYDWFDYTKNGSSDILNIIVNMLNRALCQPRKLTRNTVTLSARFKLLVVAARLCQVRLGLNPFVKYLLRERIYNSCLIWFAVGHNFSVSSSHKIRSSIKVLMEFARLMKVDKSFYNNAIPSADVEPFSDSFDMQSARGSFVGEKSKLLTVQKDFPDSSSVKNTLTQGGINTIHIGTSVISKVSKKSSNQLNSKTAESSSILKEFHRRRRLILLLLSSELERLTMWNNPRRVSGIDVEHVEKYFDVETKSDVQWKKQLELAWAVNPHLAVQFFFRYPNASAIRPHLERLVASNPMAVVDLPEAFQFLVTEANIRTNQACLKHALFWKQISPVDALNLFSKHLPPHNIVSQYGVTTLRQFSGDVLLFYIPQIVQALRNDSYGYIAEYIVYAADSSQLVAHQLIWNMKCNQYMDEDSLVPDPVLFSVCQEIIDTILNNLSGHARAFYEREFKFFGEVTGISGTLKPFPKAERRAVCKEELGKIKVVDGVYLPSNPEAVLHSIDYTSGIPMQSAAKAPFLATFYVKNCSVSELENYDVNNLENNPSYSLDPVKQSAIFKVGDDVRQDMLALQIISLCKKIFESADLPLYLYPYRVVATAPGCGVIECVPNSKSRSELGKSTDVSLYDYFIDTYGDEQSFNFQNARANFIKSMAGYTMVTYLLQIKDRHNGNLMLDEVGHLIHIDFGFMIESSPGGNIGFEPDMNLKDEFVKIMGGDMNSFAFGMFTDMCVKGYLALRPYYEQIVALVALMEQSGLPCFRTDQAIKKLTLRFQPDKTEREAVKFITKVIKDSYLNFRTAWYDKIQKYQQGIPYYTTKNKE